VGRTSAGKPLPDALDLAIMAALKRSARPGVVAEYWAFLRDHKKWWMVPIALLLLILGALLLVTQGSPLAPLIYSIF
jgi:hypothetical protein